MSCLLLVFLGFTFESNEPNSLLLFVMCFKVQFSGSMLADLALGDDSDDSRSLSIMMLIMIVCVSFRFFNRFLCGVSICQPISGEKA